MTYNGRLKIGRSYRIEGTEIIGTLVMLHWAEDSRLWRALIDTGNGTTMWTDTTHLLGD